MADNNMNNTNEPTPANPPSTPTPAPTPSATPTPAAPQEPVDMTMKQPAGVEPAAHKSHTLAIVIGVLVILAALVLGGLYLWGAMLDRQQANEAMVEEETNADAMIENENMAPAASAPNDDLSTLEADVESTDLDAMEAELDAIDAEIEASS